MSPGDLDNLLCGLDIPTDPRLLVGSGTGDDAGVYRLNDETALIQTVDFFPPMVDDPYLFGQIAAANALSDVWAMGGRPLLAMNIVGFPIKKLEKSILRDIVRGGLDKVKESGALLVGGHSIEDVETKYGLSVTGIVHPDRVLTNGGARLGDRLLLTKPLGTGILSTAIKGGLADAGTEKNIGLVMASLNRLAGEMAAKFEVHSCTDVTGFGLLGHLHEMAVASGVAMRVDASSLPLIDGAYDFALMGIIPEGAHNNKSFYAGSVDCRLAELDPLEMILYDPQTSGGLLISAPEAVVSSMAAEMARHNHPWKTAVVGEVINGPAGTITVV